LTGRDTPENEARPHYREGKIGLRQMQWTHFRYRNFRVWEVATPEQQLAAMDGLQAIHPKNRMWMSPRGKGIAEKNPPTLQWPPAEDDKATYTVRLSRDPAFSQAATYEDTHRRWALYNPYQSLEPGLWYWQYRENGKQWSPVESFLISDESVEWSPPSVETFLAKVPQYHPRVLVDAPTWKAFRARTLDSAEARRIIALADTVFDEPLPDEGLEVAEIEGETEDKTDKLQKDASKEAGQSVFQGVGPLCKAYVLTGNPRYAELAKTWALEAASWDPHGVTTINNFGDSRIMLSMALVVDTLGDYLSAEEKATLVEAVAARANRFYNKWRNWKESVVLSNHIWQHIFHYFWDTAIAMKGEHPDADTWLAYLYDKFLARAPILGGEDGAWVHGLSYFRMNFDTLIDIPHRIKQYTGFDFFRYTPWYQENPNYFLYGFPPGSAGTGFSDNSHDLPEPRGDYLAYADAMSRLVQNPYAAWYRDKIIEVTRDLTPHYQDYWRSDYVPPMDAEPITLSDSQMLQWNRLKYLYDMPAAEPKPPADLPKARAFRGVGLVTMHSQALDQPATDNLYLAMRASPYGAYSHMLGDNNTFHLVYGGDRLFYHTGYKVAMSAPHRQKYYKHTQSHNGILVNGKGQPYTTDAFAWVENFLTGDELSYAVGNASNAYDSVEDNEDAGLENFRRHVIMLRPDIVVIYDELEAEQPSTWSYLLHSYYKMEMDPKDFMLTTSNRRGRALVHLYGSSGMDWSVTDEYPVPAENWRGIRDESGKLIEYTNNAWHFKAETEPSSKQRFLAFYQVRPHGMAEDFDFNEIRQVDSNTFRIGKWRVRAAMDPGEPARIEILNTIDGIAFTSSGPLLGPAGTHIAGTSPVSAKLIETRGRTASMRESLPSIPPGAAEAIQYFTDQENH
jgi:hypothetical protein